MVHFKTRVSTTWYRWKHKVVHMQLHNTDLQLETMSQALFGPSSMKLQIVYLHKYSYNKFRISQIVVVSGSHPYNIGQIKHIYTMAQPVFRQTIGIKNRSCDFGVPFISNTAFLWESWTSIYTAIYLAWSKPSRGLLPYIQKNSLAENFAITLWLSKLASFISLVACFERNWLVKN